MPKDEITQWLKALFYCLLIAAFFAIYLYLRREIFNLYVLNKVFGSTAAVVGGLTLLVGPLFKRFRYFERENPAFSAKGGSSFGGQTGDESRIERERKYHGLQPVGVYFAHFMGIRRELGLIAFGLAIAHVIASLILQDKFAFPSWYLKELTPIIFGISAILIWFYMAYISRSSKIKQLGADVWKKRLSLSAKIAYLTIFFHLVIMKYPGWINWFRGQTKQTPELANPTYPPASLFVFFIMLAIIVFRLINDLKNHQPKEIQKPGAQI